MSDTAAPAPEKNDSEVNNNARKTGSASDATTSRIPDDNPQTFPPSPSVDVHALFGIPRTKRPSEKSEEQEVLADSDTDDLIDSDDDDFEEFQEGEYIVMEGNEECKELQTKLMSEQADLHRQILLPVFTACTSAYDQWVRENKGTLPEAEMADRRAQLELYRKVIDLYGSGADWGKVAHEQKISIDNQVLEISQRAKDMGPPPDMVTEASMAAGKPSADATFTQDSTTCTMMDRQMQNFNL